MVPPFFPVNPLKKLLSCYNLDIEFSRPKISCLQRSRQKKERKERLDSIRFRKEEEKRKEELDIWVIEDFFERKEKRKRKER